MLELIPDRTAVCSDRPTTLDLLIRITPPQPLGEVRRPELNLALVLDRSGSMAGHKMELTRQAAGLAVRSLSPQDRVSIVIFDHAVDTLVPNTPVTDKNHILQLLSRVDAGGSTALHSGWRTGGAEAEQARDARRVNRVVLLTDGQANVGETNPDTICHEVHQLAQRGVQTTTLGFGRDYNENLLRAMASSGGGNHFFVETPEQLVGYFQLELGGLAATQGTQVRLEFLEGSPDTTVEALGELERTPEGFKLGDLVSGCPLEQVFRIQLPARPARKRKPILTARLSWHCTREGRPRVLEMPLTLTALPSEERQKLPLNPDVEQHVAVAMASRARLEAMQALRKGDQAAATNLLKKALETQRLPAFERNELEDLMKTVQRGDQSSSLKKSASISHSYGSVSLHKIEGFEVFKMIGAGEMPLRTGPLLGAAPSPPNQSWGRVEGMLRGLFHGERLGRGPDAPVGEATRLALITLLHANPGNLNPAGLSRRFSAALVEDPSPSLRVFRANLDGGKPWKDAAVTRAGCAPLQRVAAVLAPCWNDTSAPLFWSQCVLCARVTHNDCAALVSCMGYCWILWDLMARDAPPPPDYYLSRFLEVRDLETDQTYTCRAPRYDGWSGRLSDFVQRAVEEARADGLSVAEACRGFGSGPYLLETVPTLLYLLERHGDAPEEALRVATQETRARGPLGALVGAAMGALYGARPEWSLPTELEAELDQVRQRLT